jgi:hypothetical protein
MAQNFVCVAEECFFLYPPDWLKNPPRPESTRFFKKYVGNAPKMWPENTSTHQGIYCMTPDGGHLSGVPGLGRHGPAKKLISDAWSKYSAKKPAMKAVPTDKIPLWGGDDLKPGGLKLRVAYRDLPRGDQSRPSSARFLNPYNLGWYDFSADEASAFRTTSREPVKVPNAVFTKFATHTLKDAVRGQCGQFKSQDLKEGSLTTQLISDSGGRSTFRLIGTAKLKDSQRSFDAKLHGIAVFEGAKFVSFDLIAAGQRTGKSGANGREADLGPAPMGVAFQLYDGS